MPCHHPQLILRWALAYNLSTADKRRIARVTEHNSPSPLGLPWGEGKRWAGSVEFHDLWLRLRLFENPQRNHRNYEDLSSLRERAVRGNVTWNNPNLRNRTNAC